MSKFNQGLEMMGLSVSLEAPFIVQDLTPFIRIRR